MIHYEKILEKYIQVFGYLFSNIHIRRWKSDKSEKQDLLVPITYMDKQRMYYLLNLKNADLASAKINSVYPRLAYSLKGVDYDANRQLNPTFMMTNNYYSELYNKDVTEIEVNKVPYNFKFDLTMVSMFRSDLFQIMEQILPWFTPSLTINMNVNPYIDTDSISIPIYLSSNTFTDFNNEAAFSETEDKPIEYTLSFLMKGYLYNFNDEDTDGTYPGSSLLKTIREIEAGTTTMDDPRPVTDDSLYTWHIPEHIGN